MMVFQLETTTGQKEISDKTTDLKLTISAIRWRKRGQNDTGRIKQDFGEPQALV